MIATTHASHSHSDAQLIHAPSKDKGLTACGQQITSQLVTKYFGTITCDDCREVVAARIMAKATAELKGIDDARV